MAKTNASIQLVNNLCMTSPRLMVKDYYIPEGLKVQNLNSVLNNKTPNEIISLMKSIEIATINHVVDLGGNVDSIVFHKLNRCEGGYGRFATEAHVMMFERPETLTELCIRIERQVEETQAKIRREQLDKQAKARKIRKLSAELSSLTA